MATIGKKAIATTASPHFAPGPAPAISMVPPTPPAGPVPGPFPYVARSRTADNTASGLKVAGAEVLVTSSRMDLDAPGNLPSTSTGGDIVTHLVRKDAIVQTGSSKVLASGRQVACTGDQVKMNVSASPAPAQSFATLMFVMMINMGADEAHPVFVLAVLDPISVASGAVLDDSVDLAIPGLIPFAWKRLYSSARAREHTPLGRGGWTHSYHQWIEIEGDTVKLHEEDGSTVVFPGTRVGEPSLHRGRRLELVRDARGGATVFSLETRLLRRYQAFQGGRAWLREIAEVAGQSIVLEYEGERLVRILDTASRTIALTHDRNGHITRVEVFPPGPPGRAALLAIHHTYGPDGELLRVADPLGATESYVYDELRRLIQKTIPTGLSIHYRYDPSTGRCVRSWGDGGLHAGDLDYDLEKGITRLTGTAEPMVFHWRPDGTVVRKSTPDGGFAEEMRFDADGLLVEHKNAAGEAYTLTRDARGNVTTIESPAGGKVELVYAGDQVVERRVNGALTRYRHDGLGRLAQVTYSTGVGLSLGYDALGRLSTLHGPDGLRGGFTYDEQHNAIEERTPRGGVRRIQFDALGRAVVFTDPVGNTVRRELDLLGRPLTLQLPDGGVIRFEHDALGRLTRRIDAMGRVEATAYAGLKSPTQITNPDGSVWSLTYDLGERLQEVKNPRGERCELRYDRAGHLRELRSFDGRITRGQHGKNGLLSHLQLPDGAYRTLRHDAAGSLTAEETPQGNVKIKRPRPRVIEYHYADPTGPSMLVLENDEHDRVMAETQNGRTIRYEYDSRNRLTARTLPTGQVTRFTHDEEGNVTSVDHEGYRVDLERDLAGTLVRKRFASIGVEARRASDPMGRLTREWVGSEQKALVDRLYTYDRGGALTERNDLRWGPTRYQYDLNGMLLDQISARGRESFTYDAGGSLSPAGASWETLPGGLLVGTERATYAHDAGSRRTKKALRSGEETAYLWDCRGYLREARLPDGTRVLFAYDPFGRRIRKEVIPPLEMSAPEGELPPPQHSRVVEYLWSGLCLAAEIDSERGVRVFVHLPGTMVPLLQQERGEVFAIVSDHLGTPTELIGPKAEVVWSARHSAFGTITERFQAEGSAGVECPFRLLGQYHDEETGLCYVRYRYFDPETARFLSPDPLDLFGGRNLFAFNGSPTNHVDPLGLSCLLIGNPAHDNAVAYMIANIRPNPNNYTVGIHGAPNSVSTRNADGTSTYYTREQLVNGINSADNYNGETSVTLNSCNTGRQQAGLAQQVSLSPFDRAVVHAPSDVIWGLGPQIGPPRGMPDSTTGPQPARLDYDPTRPGQWNSWERGQPSDRNIYNQYVTPLPGGGTIPPPPAGTPPAPLDNGLPFTRPAPGSEGSGAGGGAT
jgi:RHS repeat-associated protein